MILLESYKYHNTYHINWISENRINYKWNVYESCYEKLSIIFYFPIQKCSGPLCNYVIWSLITSYSRDSFFFSNLRYRSPAKYPYLKLLLSCRNDMCTSKCIINKHLLAIVVFSQRSFKSATHILILKPITTCYTVW